MGGQSYRCPICHCEGSERWFERPSQLKDHGRDKHGLKHFQVRGTGPATELVLDYSSGQQPLYLPPRPATG
jgi:hypothetical protein